MSISLVAPQMLQICGMTDGINFVLLGLWWKSAVHPELLTLLSCSGQILLGLQKPDPAWDSPSMLQCCPGVASDPGLHYSWLFLLVKMLSKDSPGRICIRGEHIPIVSQNQWAVQWATYLLPNKHTQILYLI